MRQKKSLLILMGILLVSCGVYVGVDKYTEAKAEAEAEAEAALIEETTIYITEIASEEVVAVSWNYYEELSFVLEDEVWLLASDTSLPIDDYYVSAVVDTFCSLTAVRELVDGDSLADYGLEDTAYSVTLTLASGEETTYYIGSASGDYYYVTIDDKTSIYTAEATVSTTIAYELISIIEQDSFPYIESTQMEEVIVDSSEEEVVYTVDDEGAFDLIAEGVSELSFTSCIECYASDNLEAYGLDEASKTVVTISYIEETTDDEGTVTEESLEAVLNVGLYDESSGIYYVQVEGSNFVYSMASDTVSSVMNLY